MGGRARLVPVPLGPLRRPRRELLLLTLCAVAVLSTVNLIDVQDQSRWCLTSALTHGRLTIGGCIGTTRERSIHDGHLYSNKAPGMSLLAVPAALAFRYSPSPVLHQYVGFRLWLIRLFACGLPFLLAAWLVGRVCETLRPGTGGPALVTFALGTAVAPFAVVGFDHVPTAAFAFSAFVLAWRRRDGLAGVAAGAAVLCEYEAAVIVAILAGYVALRGRRSLLRYVLGVLPGCVLLGAYDWAAFGAPWHTPLPYSDNEYRAVHTSGLLGVHLPSLHSARTVFFGSGGLLVLSPVLALAVLGLVQLWRARMRAEAAVCGLVTFAFVVAECGYGDPNGGFSPLPRYLIPCLPFLAVGLAPAFARLHTLTVALALPSIVAMMAVTLTWMVFHDYPGGVWASIISFPADRSSSLLVRALAPNALGWLGVTKMLAGAVAILSALAAFAFSLELGAGVRLERMSLSRASTGDVT